MKKISEIFNSVSQPFRDAINGFEPKSPMSWLCAGVGGFNIVQAGSSIMAASALTGGAGISLLFAAVCFSGLWHHGRNLRNAGHPPKYVP